MSFGSSQNGWNRDRKGGQLQVGRETVSEVMKRSFRAAAYAVLIVAISAGIWWAYREKRPETALPGRAGALKPEPHAGRQRSGTAAPSAATGNQPAMVAENLLQRLAADLDAHRAEKSRSELAGLHARLQKLPRNEAAGQLLAFLKSGVDAGTGLPFEVGRGGRLTTAPTLRVAALDWLGEFDPAAAAEMARQVFASSSSADEWALALRNYYRQNQPPDAYFVARVGEAVSREDWLQNPSAGLAESLDFPVAIGGSDGFGVLLGLLQRSPAMRWAALAALDAWVLEGRATAIPLLAGTDAGALDEGSRAAMLARADIRDEAQRQAIESYLAAARVPEGAKAEFLRQFPNQSMIVGNHLVTASRPMTLRESAQLDVAALQFVDGLIKEGSRPELSKELGASRERLAGFVESARKGGQL